MLINGIEFEKTPYGMLKQKGGIRYNYTSEYLAHQSTTREMSALRLGFLMGVYPYDRLINSTVLELGPGTGVFFNFLKPHVARLEGYDIVEDSSYSTISLKEVQEKKWDLLVAFDVLEHFEELDDLFKIDFKVGFFSSPAPPKSITDEWRHWKPDEHRWIFTSSQFSNWVEGHGYTVAAHGCPEDLIRTRWSSNQPNINSFIIEKA